MNHDNLPAVISATRLSAPGQPIPALPEALHAAYRRALYRVFALGSAKLPANSATPARLKPDTFVEFQLGAANPDLAGILKCHGAKHAAFLSAFNPFSRRLGITRNRQRHAALLQAIGRAGLVGLPGEGADPAGRWPAEASVLVLDASETRVDAWMVRFEQHACVWIEASGISSMHLHPDHRGERPSRSAPNGR